MSTTEHPLITRYREVAEADPIFGEVIHAYSRAQALEDGVLRAVPEATAREAGFRYPVAMTAAAWGRAVAGGTTKGRLWDVLYLGSIAVRRAAGANRAPYRLKVGRRNVELVIHVGPGDDAEPVLTIMLPGED